MASTINFLSDEDSLVRFPPNSTANQTAAYLNNGTSPRYSWSATGGTIVATADVIKLPSCNSLLVSPSSTLAMTLRLAGSTVDGTVLTQRPTLRYGFHCLMLSSQSLTVVSKLESRFRPENPRTTTIPQDLFSVVRSNVVTFSSDLELPTNAYRGSQPFLDIELTISGHGGQPFYVTYPALIDIDAWQFNSAVPAMARNIPTMFRDIDEIQDPEYPFFKLVDILSHQIGESSRYYSNWFRFELEDLPLDSLPTDQFALSQLTDPYVSNRDALEWAAQVVGKPAVRETYALDPSTGVVSGWRNRAYPLDMTGFIQADVASINPIDIATDLIYVEKWSPVRTVSLDNINISSGLVNGQTIAGVTVATGDRVLLKHQLAPAENGIYIVAASGAASRSTDADSSGEFTNNKSVYVEDGLLASTYWQASIPTSFTLNTSPVSFSQLYSPGVIDSVDLSVGSKVLLLNQDNPADNGVYIVNSGSPATRHNDLNQSSEFIDGLHIEVNGGSVYAGTIWRLYAERPIVLGEDPVEIAFIDRYVDFLRSQVSTAMYGHAAGSVRAVKDACVSFLTGNRRIAIEPNVPTQFNVTIKTILSETLGVESVSLWSPCRVATTEDISLSGGLIAGAVVDGVVLASGDRILVKEQVTESENGIYVVPTSGAASRATDADTPGEFTIDKAVYIQAGDLHADTYFTIDDIPITMGTSTITFQRSLTLGASSIILAAAEHAKPLGFTFSHQTLNKFALTFDSPALGRLGTGELG